MFQTFTADNGLRIILTPSSTDVVYAGIAVATGTRHEFENESGMAHLVEHMTFKGTHNLTSVQILNRMESVGGDLNAFTGKEETIYYATFMRQHLHRALELLLNIVFDSTYPQEELEKEREVVADEIESYNDSPAELIFDDFEALLFPDHPLGRNILGDVHRLRQYTSTDLQNFVHRNYSPSRTVLFVKGKVSEIELRRTLKGLLDFTIVDCQTMKKAFIPSGSQSTRPSNDLPSSSPVVVQKNCHQSHVLLGNRAFSFVDPRHPALFLLNNILGGPAMNSRLSLALRERTGLVYSVESSINSYTDTGVWCTYFGCDHDDVQRCLQLVHKELRHLCDTPLPPRTLATAKRQLKGQLGVANDNFENMALGMAKYYLHTNSTLTLEQRFEQIDALTPEQLQDVAKVVMNPAHLTTLIFQ